MVMQRTANPLYVGSIPSLASSLLFNSDMNFSFLLAFRYFRSKKNNGWLSFISGFAMIGVMLGVAALIVVMAVMNGFHEDITKNIIGIGGHIYVRSTDRSMIANVDELRDDIASINTDDTQYIQSVIPIIDSKGMVMHGEYATGALVYGIDYEDLQNKKQIFDNVLFGDLSAINENFNVALGKELALALRVHVGETINLITTNTVHSLLGSMPRSKTLNVVAVFSSGLYDYDTVSMIMSRASASKIFSKNTLLDKQRGKIGADQIEIFLTHTDKTDKAKKLLYNKLDASKYHVITWAQHNNQFLTVLRVEKVTMFTILTLIIVVAAFNIISTLFMLVYEKNKDIAILRTIGATRWQIMLAFIITGSIIGTIGTALGWILGVSIAYNIGNIKDFLESITGTTIFDAAIYYLYHLPSKVILSDVLSVGFLSLLLCVLATIYPAYKASRLSPAEILR